MMKRLSLLFVVISAILLAACGGGPIPTSEQPGGTTSPDATPNEAPPADDANVEPTAVSPTATPEAAFPGDGPWDVSLTTTDGITLNGRLYGQGDRVLVLAPMYPGEQVGWVPFAEYAASQGYRVLTFDFRGYGASEGQRSASDAPTDLSAAIAFLASHDMNQVVVFGAGMGGIAGIQATSQESAIIGLAALSSPYEFEGLSVTDADLATLTIPTLWIATRNDMAQRAEEMYAAAGSASKELWIYEGSSLPGTYIFEGADAIDLQNRLIAFAIAVFDG